MKKETVAAKKKDEKKECASVNQKVNYFGAGRLLDYLDA